MDMDVNGISICWKEKSPIPNSDASQTRHFSLTITNETSSNTLSLNESFYYFSAPSNAPPCEVYNFSVIATYIGATYTGDGCSVPSKILSVTLPSLPDIVRFESSLEYFIQKHSFAEIVLRASFMVRSIFVSFGTPWYLNIFMSVHSQLIYVTAILWLSICWTWKAHQHLTIQIIGPC